MTLSLALAIIAVALAFTGAVLYVREGNTDAAFWAIIAGLWAFTNAAYHLT